jgi:hypothetical protein
VTCGISLNWINDQILFYILAKLRLNYEGHGLEYKENNKLQITRSDSYLILPTLINVINSLKLNQRVYSLI